MQQSEPGTLGASTDSLQSMFEPDVLLPAQFFDGRKYRVFNGERKLMAALLVDGVEAYVSTSLREEEEFPEIPEEDTGSYEKDARFWVHTRDRNYVFSFDNVCESLGLDPDYVRRGLQSYVGVQRTKRREGLSFGWKKIRRPRK